MTAADIAAYIETADPAKEVVILTCSDGETYKSRKFKTLSGGHVSANTDSDAAINVTLSSQTATVNWNGVTDGTCTLTLYGAG